MPDTKRLASIYFSAVLLHWLSTYFMQVIGSAVQRTRLFNWLEMIPMILIGTFLLFRISRQQRAISKEASAC